MASIAKQSIILCLLFTAATPASAYASGMIQLEGKVHVMEARTFQLKTQHHIFKINKENLNRDQKKALKLLDKSKPIKFSVSMRDIVSVKRVTK